MAQELCANPDSRPVSPRGQEKLHKKFLLPRVAFPSGGKINAMSIYSMVTKFVASRLFF